MKDNDIPVTIADSNFTHLRDARYADIPVYFGEILSEVREHRLDVHSFSHLIATSDNDAYNALVCTELAHEFGRTNVLQLATSADEKNDNQTMSFTVGGRRLFLNPIDLDEANDRVKSGETIQTTLLSDEFTFDDYLATRSERNRVIGVIKTNGGLEFATPNGKPKAQASDKVLSLGPPQKANQDVYE